MTKERKQDLNQQEKGARAQTMAEPFGGSSVATYSLYLLFMVTGDTSSNSNAAFKLTTLSRANRQCPIQV